MKKIKWNQLNQNKEIKHSFEISFKPMCTKWKPVVFTNNFQLIVQWEVSKQWFKKQSSELFWEIKCH